MRMGAHLLPAASAQYLSTGGCPRSNHRPAQRGWIARVDAYRSAKDRSASRGQAAGRWNPWWRQILRSDGSTGEVDDFDLLARC